MSNVIKSSRVLYNEAPREISIVTAGPSAGQSVLQMLSKNTVETADLYLKRAVAKAEEVKSRSRIETQQTLLNAVDEGRRQGHEDGLVKGRSDGLDSAKKNVRDAAGNFIAQVCSLDMKYLAQLKEAKADCVEFAFGLAEDVLGVQIDRESDDYAELLKSFLSQNPDKVTLEVDGCSYKLETFMADGLLSSANGLPGISVIVEAPIEDSEQEMQEKADEQAAEIAQAPEGDACDAPAGSKAQLDFEASDIEAEIENEDAQNNKTASGYNEPLENTPELPESDKFKTMKIEDVSHIGDMLHIDDMPNIEDTVKIDEKSLEDNPDKSEQIDYDTEPQYASAANNNEDDDGVDDNREDIIDSNKFVFVRPARKSVIISSSPDSPEEQAFYFEDIARTGHENLKALSRKAEIKDIAAALNGASEEVTSAFMGAMPRRIKENVLDVMKYLGPMAQADTDAARDKLVKLSADIMKARERDETDV